VQKGELMHATITTLRIPNAAARAGALDQLAVLVRTAGSLAGVVTACVVETGHDEITMVTVYADEAAAEAASDELRPALAEAIGPLVSGPPERRAGSVAAFVPALGGADGSAG
jgi:hypothetical protein